MSDLQALKEAVARNNWVILDTETTGLTTGEIVQIAILGQNGVLLDSLCKPQYGIPLEASRIHGITEDMVADAPTFDLLAPTIQQLLQGKDVIVYNATYDRKMLHQSAEAVGIAKIDWKTFSNWVCAMLAYAEFWGDFNEYYGNYRWQKLTRAMEQQGLEISQAHNALGDCLMTMQLVDLMTAPEGVA